MDPTGARILKLLIAAGVILVLGGALLLVSPVLGALLLVVGGCLVLYGPFAEAMRTGVPDVAEESARRRADAMPLGGLTGEETLIRSLTRNPQRRSNDQRDAHLP